MRFSTRFPKLRRDDGGAWVAMEPPPWTTGLPAMVLIGGGLGLGTLYLFSIASDVGLWDLFVKCPPWKMLLAALVMMPAHELCHGLMHPGFGMSSSTHFGFHPKRAVAFCIYDSAVSRIRAFVMLVFPFVLLTVVPLALAFTGVRLEFWAVVAVVNATGVGGDLIFAALLTLIQKGASIGVDDGRMMYRPTLRCSATTASESLEL